MNILQNFTEHKAGKIAECISTIGNYGTKPVINSQNRNLVRGWLNGIGFPTDAYINTSLEGLAKAYYSCHDGRGLHLIPFIINSGISPSNPDDVLANLQAAISRLDGSFYGPLPELQDVVGYIKYAGIEEPGKPIPSNTATPIPLQPHQQTTVEALTNAGGVARWITEQSQPKPQSQPITGEKNVMPIAERNQVLNDDAQDDAQKAIAMLMQALNKPKQVAEIDESRVIELIKKHGVSTSVNLTTSKGTVEIPTGLHHECLPLVVKMLSAGVNVMLVGAAGSGKTTIADQCAKILSVPFYFNGALSSEYKLSGFVDAQGRIVSTAFRKAYESGGLYLFDEIDASMPDALLAFNAALANGHADFPDGSVNRHEKFLCMAAANTFGRGADRIYVGRNQLDGASLDRFAVLNVDYDEKLELALAGNNDWVKLVQKIRKAVFDLKIRHIVSPRASINGAKLLAAGIKERDVLEMVIWKGLDKDSVSKIRNQANI